MEKESVMAVAANYVVVMDGKKRLKSGDSFNVSCPVPDNFAANFHGGDGEIDISDIVVWIRVNA